MTTSNIIFFYSKKSSQTNGGNERIYENSNTDEVHNRTAFVEEQTKPKSNHNTSSSKSATFSLKSTASAQSSNREEKEEDMETTDHKEAVNKETMGEPRPSSRLELNSAKTSKSLAVLREPEAGDMDVNSFKAMPHG